MSSRGSSRPFQLLIPWYSFHFLPTFSDNGGGGDFNGVRFGILMVLMWDLECWVRGMHCGLRVRVEEMRVGVWFRGLIVESLIVE